MSTVQPLSRYVLSRRCVLDTLFVNQSTRRAAYATTTDGAVTTLSCVNHRGALLEVAQIRWLGDPASQGSSTVVVNGQSMLVDNVLKRSKSFFGSDSRIFTAGTKHCKWKCGERVVHTPNPGRILPSEYQLALVTSPSIQSWTCCGTNPNPTSTPRRRPNTSTSSSTSSSSTSPVPLLAVFYPPQTGLVKSEITIYQDGDPIIDHVILTAILICARKDEWRTAQSAVSRATLEASLKAEIRGTLPPYLPIAADRYRVTTASSTTATNSSSTSSRPRPLRRLQSINVTRNLYTYPSAPPPYTSVDEISVPNR